MQNMKYIYISIIFILLFMSCHTTKNDVIEEQLESIDKAEAFKSGEYLNPKDGILYFSLESTHLPSSQPTTSIMEAISVMFTGETERERAIALDSYLENEFIKGKSELELAEIVVHATLSYMNLSMNILAIEDNAELAKKTLLRILKYSKNPVEWKLLTDALLAGRSAFSKSDFNKYKSILQSKINSFTKESPAFYKEPIESHLRISLDATKERLMQEAKSSSNILSSL